MILKLQSYMYILWENYDLMMYIIWNWFPCTQTEILAEILIHYDLVWRELMADMYQESYIPVLSFLGISVNSNFKRVYKSQLSWISIGNYIISMPNLWWRCTNIFAYRHIDFSSFRNTLKDLFYQTKGHYWFVATYGEVKHFCCNTS